MIRIIIFNLYKMTIINTQEELEEITLKWELDIKMWNTYSFKEVYEHLYSNEKLNKYV